MIGALLWFEISSALGLVEGSGVDMVLRLVFMILGIIYGLSADKVIDKYAGGYVNLRID